MGENNDDTYSEIRDEPQTQANGGDGVQKRNVDVLYDEGKTEEKPFKKLKKIKAFDDVSKNPVSILNEMYKGLKYNFVQQKGPSNNPIFTVEVEVAGAKFLGQGRSKALAKHNVAKKVLETLDPSKSYPEAPNDAINWYSSAGSPENETDVIGEKNPVSVLNELRSGLKYDVLEQHGPSHAPSFKIAVLVDGQTFYGVGRSKKLAKCAAAEEALKSFIQFPNNKGIKSAPENTKCDFSLDQFEVKKKPTTRTAPVSKGPVMQLNEVFPSAEYECIDTEGDIQSRYRVTVHINGRKFIGTGSSKKFAKKAAAATALYGLLDIRSPVVNNNSPGYRRTNVTAQEQEKADLIGRLVNEKFTSLMAEDLAHAKRKVLAGIVQTHGDDLSSAKVICVTTGTKCISGSYMSLNGSALNDLHAEIVARRCLMSYFYDQLNLLLLDEESVSSSIFVFDETLGSYCLKPDIEFHLYINTAPCGDARIFSPHEEELGADKHPNRISRGQLRTKIESGEGTIPVKSSFLTIQTWDGVLQGERLLTMSCSDKICKWNVLGVQGALLSNIIEPIYFRSVVLGSLLHDTHLQRAIAGRIANTLQGLPPPYRLNKPPAYLITSSEVRHPTKAPSFAVNWIIGDSTVEIVNTENGKLENGSISKLCKLTLLTKYFHLITNLRIDHKNSKTTCPVYCEAKNANPKYLVAKKALYDAFLKASLGTWVSKPIEQEMFEFMPLPNVASEDFEFEMFPI